MDSLSILVCGSILQEEAYSEFWNTNGRSLVRCPEGRLESLALSAGPGPRVLIVSEAVMRTPAFACIVQSKHLGHEIYVLAVIERNGPPALDLLRLGCNGILSAGCPPDLLERAINAVLGGEIWAPRRSVAALVSELLHAVECKRTALTQRESCILDLALRGHTNAEIADRLFISRATVRWHKRRLHRKIGKLGDTWNDGTSQQIANDAAVTPIEMGKRGAASEPSVRVPRIRA